MVKQRLLHLVAPTFSGRRELHYASTNVHQHHQPNVSIIRGEQLAMERSRGRESSPLMWFIGLRESVRRRQR